MPEAPRLVPHTPKAAKRPRGSSTARGYGTRHRKARKRLLELHPICQVCGRDWSTDRHHVAGDKDDFRAEAELAVCEACHHGTLHAN